MDALANNGWDEAKLSDWGVSTIPKWSESELEDFFQNNDEPEKEHEQRLIKCPNCGHEFEQ